MQYNQTVSPSTMLTTSYPHKNQYTIEVSGDGTVSIAPDKVIIVLGTITEDKNLNTAQKENAKAVSNIINGLLKLNIPKERIQTVNYRVDIQYDYVDGIQTFRGYKVTHLLQVTIDQVDQTGLVVDTAVYNGANSVSNIQFTTAHPEIYYNQALALAIQNAQQKAVTIAKTIGVTLNTIPNHVQEVSRTLEPSPFQMTLHAESTITPIQPGELKISAVIKAQYFYF